MFCILLKQWIVFWWDTSWKYHGFYNDSIHWRDFILILWLDNDLNCCLGIYLFIWLSTRNWWVYKVTYPWEHGLLRDYFHHYEYRSKHTSVQARDPPDISQFYSHWSTGCRLDRCYEKSSKSSQSKGDCHRIQEQLQHSSIFNYKRKSRSHRN